MNLHSTILPAEDPAADAGRRRRILRARAVALARPPAPPPLTEGLPVTCFTLGGRHFAVETALVAEVFMLRELTRIPGAPPFIAGVANRRGIVFTLLDFRTLIDLPNYGIADIHAAVALRSDGMEMGLIADTLLGAALVPPEKIQPAATREYLRGVTPEGLHVLDAERLLADERLLVNVTAPRMAAGRMP